MYSDNVFSKFVYILACTLTIMLVKIIECVTFDAILHSLLKHAVKLTVFQNTWLTSVNIFLNLNSHFLNILQRQDERNFVA